MCHAVLNLHHLNWMTDASYVAYLYNKNIIYTDSLMQHRRKYKYIYNAEADLHTDTDEPFIQEPKLPHTGLIVRFIMKDLQLTV